MSSLREAGALSYLRGGIGRARPRRNPGPFQRGRQQTRIVAGLPSIARGGSNPAAVGRDANGSADVALLGLGTAYVTIGLQANPALRRDLRPLGPGFAQLVQFAATSGHWRYIADLGAYEEIHNPDGRLPDSNPYGLLAEPGAVIVTDAGGNSLLRVAANGQTCARRMLRLTSAGARSGAANWPGRGLSRSLLAGASI